MNKQEIERAIKYWKEFKGEIPELKESYPDAGLGEQEECVDMAIFALTQQLNNGWIPVSERLPNIGETVLLTVAVNRGISHEYGSVDEQIEILSKAIKYLKDIKKMQEDIAID